VSTPPKYVLFLSPDRFPPPDRLIGIFGPLNRQVLSVGWHGIPAFTPATSTAVPVFDADLTPERGSDPHQILRVSRATEFRAGPARNRRRPGRNVWAKDLVVLGGILVVERPSRNGRFSPRTVHPGPFTPDRSLRTRSVRSVRTGDAGSARD